MGAEAGHWLQVKLQGVTANRAAIGARVYVYAGEAVYMREVSGGRGTTSQDSLILHFGLGDVDEVDKLIVLWPNPAHDATVIHDVAADRRLLIIEGKDYDS